MLVEQMAPRKVGAKDGLSVGQRDKSAAVGLVVDSAVGSASGKAAWRVVGMVGVLVDKRVGVLVGVLVFERVAMRVVLGGSLTAAKWVALWAALSNRKMEDWMVVKSADVKAYAKAALRVVMTGMTVWLTGARSGD